ncbi:MAG TPA: hypothetical protein VF529_03855 [Solirubrobacteraceae bacterium]
MSDDYRDWKITLPFTVPVGDTDGVLTEALFDAAVHHAPSEARGIVARADTSEGKVWIVFTLTNSSQGFAQDLAKQMRERVAETVFSGDDACVSAT